jgi:acylphosphatase
LAQAKLIAGRCRLTVIYTGRVQGVGFRYAAKTVAAGFEITGTVRNLPTGVVELIAEGQREELEAFRAAIRDAGLAGFIDNERLQWDSAGHRFRGFEIIN